MKQFIYVFSDEDRDRLQNDGFILLKSDETDHVYIFKSRSDLQFTNYSNIKMVQSDVLTF